MEEEPRKDAILEYSPRDSNRRRRRAIHWTLLLCAIGVIAYSAVKLAPVIQRRIAILALQHRLMYAPVERGVVYTFQPIELNENGVPPFETTATGSAIEQGNFDWVHYGREIGSPSRQNTVVYTHAIRDRSGNELLIAVQVVWKTDALCPELLTDLIEPGTLLRYPAPAAAIASRFSFENPELTRYPQDKFRIFRGEPDQNDPSHFTIDYELNGQRHTLDGYLDDQDVLKIQKRRDPTTQPLPSSSDQSP